MRNAFLNIPRPNTPISILLLMGCLAMWLPDFLQPAVADGSFAISLPVSYVFHFGIRLQLALALGLTLLNGLFVSGLMARFGIQRKWSMMPMLIYVLFVSACPSGRYALEGQVAVLLLCMVLLLTKETFKETQAVEHAFLCGLLITVAAMFLPDMVLFLPLLWLAFVLERALSLRMLLASFIGVCAVVVFWVAYLAWYQCFHLMGDALAALFCRHLPAAGIDRMQAGYFLLVAFSGCFGIISYSSNIYRESTPTRAILGVTILFSILSMPAVFFPADNAVSAFPLLALWAGMHGAYLCLSGQTVSRSVWCLFVLAFSVAARFLL